MQNNSEFKALVSPPFFFIFSVFLFISVTGCVPSSIPKVELHGKTMGTTYSIAYFWGEPNDRAPDSAKVHKDIKQRLLEINQVASTYIPDSELSLLNQHNKADAYPLSKDLNLLLKEAIDLAHITDGALDVTVGPLVNLWGFGPDKQPNKMPTEAQIAKAREHSGIDKIQLQQASVIKLVPELYVDLSTIAKGFAVDQIAEILESHGIHNYLVEIGGELRVKGRKSDEQLWRIAIEKPMNEMQTVQRILQPGNNGVATSGDYRNYFERDGVRYSHIIDPATGHPINHRLVSVTVFHPECMLADGLATGFMVLGREKAMHLANEKGIAALFIEKLPNGEFEESFSESMQDYIKD